MVDAALAGVVCFAVVLVMPRGTLTDARGSAWSFVLTATVRLTTIGDVKASWGRKTIKES
ncbi:hypothetical protein CR51_17745 [Caballeronia megalochromosomata]|jgi:hypothetical protein|nr:hypothetical protein CR51_17745 [Caballeronia megalochromosomata]